MEQCIAVFHAGSSIIKFALYDAETVDQAHYKGRVEEIGVSPRLQVSDAQGRSVAELSWPAEGFDHAAATGEVLRVAIELLGRAQVAGVGHRVVHGGVEYATP